MNPFLVQWKSPGIDKVPNFWLHHISAIHKLLPKHMSEIVSREFKHDNEYDNHNEIDQPYRFRYRCGKFDVSIDTRRGGRIYVTVRAM